ncbi:unnamed protein product [Blepharisma stoltei]|uniref:Uncharacterized protein n=1 Tax=Blepharisma stoltei TaxID=1481888 RepID=A0AAU9I3L8_9CILI|nr:unnamed protein product [Blepharisma stoltei]
MKKDHLAFNFHRKDLELILESSTPRTAAKSPLSKTPSAPKSAISPQSDNRVKQSFKYLPDLESPNKSLNLEGISFNSPSSDSLLKQLKYIEEERNSLRAELNKYKDENRKLAKMNKELRFKNSFQQTAIDNLTMDLKKLKYTRGSVSNTDFIWKATNKSMSRPVFRSKEFDNRLSSPQFRNSSNDYSEDVGNISATLHERRLRLKQATKNFYYKHWGAILIEFTINFYYAGFIVNNIYLSYLPPKVNLEFLDFPYFRNNDIFFFKNATYFASLISHSIWEVDYKYYHFDPRK